MPAIAAAPATSLFVIARFNFDWAIAASAFMSAFVIVLSIMVPSVPPETAFKVASEPSSVISANVCV